MAENHVLLETIELTQNVATVTFDNIPQSGYTDLKVVISARTNAGAGVVNCSIAINGSTSNFSQRFLYGTGSGVVSSANRSDNLNMAFANGSGSTVNTYSNEEFYFPNYTASRYKTFIIDKVTENNGTEAYHHLNGALWSDNTAISSISFTPQNSNLYIAGSTFSLYGIAKLNTTPTIAPKATGGNIVANDGTYWYHAFLSSGTFTPQTALTCDYLVVAGGGGGGSNAGGGGGAGGLRLATLQSLTSNANYVVTIGAGGMYGATNGSTTATNGTNSSFSSYSSTGGGRGAMNGVVGNSGGSGGGGAGAGYAGGSGNAGSYSPVEGYAGGNGVSFAGAGGGGAGAAASNASGSNTASNGGAGANSYNGTTFTAWLTATSTGVSGYLAGGGGGGSEGGSKGTGGSGGGGDGGQANANGLPATINTGSGGGGGSNGGAVFGGTGASGIVIIRYSMV